MKISLFQEGGWAAGISQQKKSIDLGELDEESCVEGRRLTERLKSKADSKQRDTSRARDSIVFTIGIDDDGRSAAYSEDSTALSDEFADLLSWVKRQLAVKRERKTE